VQEIMKANEEGSRGVRCTFGGSARPTPAAARDEPRAAKRCTAGNFHSLPPYNLRPGHIRVSGSAPCARRCGSPIRDENMTGCIRIRVWMRDVARSMIRVGSKHHQVAPHPNRIQTAIQQLH